MLTFIGTLINFAYADEKSKATSITPFAIGSGLFLCILLRLLCLWCADYQKAEDATEAQGTAIPDTTVSLTSLRSSFKRFFSYPCCRNGESDSNTIPATSQSPHI